MKVADLSARPAVTIGPDATIHDAAAEMARCGVGCLVIVDGERLTGIVTDRDLVIRGLAKGLAPDTRVDSVMSMNVHAIDRHADVREAIAAFRHHAVRRMPVVDHDQVTGLVSLDDLVVLLTNVLGDVTHGLTAQVMFPHAGDEPPVPALPTLR